MQYLQIHQLNQKGFKVATIAKKLGISRNTVYNVLEQSPEEYEEWILTLGNRGKKLDFYQDLLLCWLHEHPDLSSAQVYDWLKERYNDLNIGESTVRRYVRNLREQYCIPKRITMRSYQAVEELPMGKQVQVDFGETNVKTANGTSQKLWFIGFVLAHSRYKYVEWRDRPFTTRDVIQCHEAAFEYFGGMPEEIVYDQDHLIAVSENAGDIVLTKEFQSYQQMRKFGIYLCRKSDPETKGKIENVVKYVKANFSKNRVFSSIDVWNDMCLAWLKRTGNFKIHHTTKKRPFEVHALEKQHLKTVSSQFSFENSYSNSITRNIQKDNVVKFQSNRYTVPTGTYRRKYSNRAYLEVTEEQRLLIRLSPNGEVIANHKIHNGKGALIQDPAHKRKKSTKLDTLEQELRKAFEDKDQIDLFLTILKENYPRHRGDQLSILSHLILNEPKWINQALREAMKLQLRSANDLRDLLYALKQTEKHEILSKELTDHQASNYSHITATTRDIDSYIAIMNGGKSA